MTSSKSPGGGDPFEVLVQNGGLALDIPGRRTSAGTISSLKVEFDVLWDDGGLAFRHPLENLVIHLDAADEEGWYDGEFGGYRVSFEPGDAGTSVTMIIDAMNSFPKR